MASPWMQELVWVRRNDNGVIVGVSFDPPKTGDLIPTVPTVKRTKSSKPEKKKK